MIRHDWNDQIFRSLKEKDEAIIKKISEWNKNSQPLLIFTANINKSEHYSELLNKAGIEHTVFRGLNHNEIVRSGYTVTTVWNIFTRD